MTNQEKLQKLQEDNEKRITELKAEAKQEIELCSSLLEISRTDIDILIVRLNKIKEKIRDLENELSAFERVSLTMDI
ncbi:hypothetical protein [Brevibacillus laterosporus]|uniref:hypothetical protein n=1 Tax=Brevibacillus laterosporus TaxID=1465 RepID=UPI00215C479F|nr:hypothetical protein [Brevibacillus laterosporus]MCR8994597.1 hypothetical protein [Brevibacillus laterosporus]